MDTTTAHNAVTSADPGEEASAMREDPPKSLSELLYIAVEDARAMERMRTINAVPVFPDARYWHMPQAAQDGRLRWAVCFAGAVMATRSTPAQAACKRTPRSFTAPWRAAFLALDAARRGEWAEAMGRIDQSREAQGATPGATQYLRARRWEFARRVDRAIDPVHEDLSEFRSWSGFGDFLDFIENRALPRIENVEYAQRSEA